MSCLQRGINTRDMFLHVYFPHKMVVCQILCRRSSKAHQYGVENPAAYTESPQKCQWHRSATSKNTNMKNLWSTET